MTTNYQKGITYEYKVINQLREHFSKRHFREGVDYVIVRSAGSHSPVDITFFNFAEGEIHLWQIKRNNDSRGGLRQKDRWLKDKEFVNFSTFPPIIAIWKHFWVYGTQGAVIFKWDEKNYSPI
jgi:hypothetical protein